MKTHTKTLLTALSATAALVLVAGSAHAAVITPTSATSTTTIGGSRTITAAIDGSGLSGGGLSGDILSETHAAAGSSAHWLSDLGVVTAGLSTTEVLTFNLGGAFDVDKIYLWDYIRPERDRGIKTFDIAFSDDGGSTFGAAVSASSLGMADFTRGSNNNRDIASVQTRTISAQSGVTNIRFTNIQNFGTQDRLAISEIRFGSAPVSQPIPEPASLAVGLIGLGGLALRRRRNA